MLSEYLMIGQVLRPQGVQGMVKVRPDTDFPDRFLRLDHVFTEKNGVYKKTEITNVDIRGGFVYLKLSGVSTREDAEKQRDLILYIDRAHAVSLGKDDNFICDLIGCRVIDEEGAEIGRIEDVLQPGSNDVYVIRTESGNLLAPALRQVFTQVDVINRMIVADRRRFEEVAVLDH